MGTRRRVAAVLGVAFALTIGTACSDSSPDAMPETAAPPSPTTPRINGDQCRQDPPTGGIDRAGHDLSFARGSVHVAVGEVGVDNEFAAPEPECFEFGKFGNTSPEVPPDSLLFFFADGRGSGTQIEFLISELTGGVVPPVGGVRPEAAPLRGPISAQIGVAFDGIYYQSPGCALHLTSMSADQAAGWFECGSAAPTPINPFAPVDDLDQSAPDEDDSADAAEGPPPLGTSSEADTEPAEPRRLTGWFEVRP